LVEGKKFFLSHQPSIFQEHAVQRCQSRKPKGCGNGKRRAKLGNRLGKDNIHQGFSTSCSELLNLDLTCKNTQNIVVLLHE